MTSATYDDVKDALDRNGMYAAACGIASITSAMTMACTCYVSLLLGIAFGAIAILLGQRTRAMGAEGEARAYSNVGVITGAIGLGWSLLISALIALYIAAYVVMVVAMIVLGNL